LVTSVGIDIIKPFSLHESQMVHKLKWQSSNPWCLYWNVL